MASKGQNAATAEALIYTAPGLAKRRALTLDPLGPGDVEVETLYSGLSRGTERLVSQGLVPASEHERMRAPFQRGAFPFPVAYGYAAVGRVTAGDPDRLGETVFALHPHQTRFRVPGAAAVPVPPGVPAHRAVLAANSETALNAIWDAQLVPGTRVAVIGAGLLGCLIAGLLSRRSDIDLILCDVIGARRALALELNVTFAEPTELPRDRVVTFHTSATAAGLATALGCLAFEGRVIELSWYGDRPVSLVLGGAFHANRLSIVSSQVGHVAGPRRATTSHRRRLELALEALSDPRLDALVTEEIAFDALAPAIPRLLSAEAPGIATRVKYG
ncbi:MAG: zinc-binding alcohol dehydrogenase [Pseudomonadota bacterium]